MVYALNPAPVARVQAKGRIVRSGLLDEVDTVLELADGAQAHVEASRVADARDRKMVLDYAAGRIAIDFIARSVDNTTAYELRDIFPAGEDQTGVAGDPLGFALDRFLLAARGEAPPLVSGAEARFALALAEQIRAAVS
jgi:hypothetical protein